MATIQQYAKRLAAHHAKRYWSVMHALPPQKFPIVDSFHGDDDVGTTLDAIDAMQRVGYHGLQVGMSNNAAVSDAIIQSGNGDVHAAGASPTLPCSTRVPGERTAPSCSIRDWLRSNDTDAELANQTAMRSWASTVASGWKAAGYQPGTVKFGAMHDEPGWTWEMPPVATSSVIRDRWVSYLRAQNLTATELGAAELSQTEPLGREEARQRIGTCHVSQQAGAELAARKLYYWSVRYNAWEPVTYFRNATHALESEFGSSVHLYVNWNNVRDCLLTQMPQGLVCFQCAI
jgi:hypothetical protein